MLYKQGLSYSKNLIKGTKNRNSKEKTNIALYRHSYSKTL